MPTPASAIAAQPDPSPLPGVSRLICVASKQYPRYSEADVIDLADGRLLLALARKSGSSDFAPGTLIGSFSSDCGLSWDDQPHVIQGPFDDVKDLMSVSLFCTGRGLHLLFLGRGPDAKADTRIYQMLSSDEAQTWTHPQRVSQRPGYHIVNNARVIRTSKGRVIVPVAFTENTTNRFNAMRLFCLCSDDDAQTWKQSAELTIQGKPLMEPGVAECADGSIYMTIRTTRGHVYEARSHDAGMTWSEPRPTKLPSISAPATVLRDPTSKDLWIIWNNRSTGGWKDRTPLSLACSHDHGATWSKPRSIEDNPRHGYAYTSIRILKDQVLLTYYDWPNRGQPAFESTSLRQRTIPLAWFHEQPVPPVFRKHPNPVLKQDHSWEGRIISCNSGLLVGRDRWRLWYTTGTLGPSGEQLKICCAESLDRGITWTPTARPDAAGPDTNIVLPPAGSNESAYHGSIQRDGANLLLYAWRRGPRRVSGLYRHVSGDDGKSFALDPDRPLFVAWSNKGDAAKLAGEDHASNDAFDITTNPRGTMEYFCALMKSASDPRAIVRQDNAAGHVRVIGRAASADGIEWSPIDAAIVPDYQSGDPFDTQFYGIQMMHYRGFYLGLLHVFHARSQIIQPEWAWSHDGMSWARTGLPAIALGDEGAFDCRMIVFGAITLTSDELIWLYTGANWRHNAFRRGAVSSSIGRAVLPRRELDAWLDSLPQP
jgi:hypothetical protein